MLHWTLKKSKNMSISSHTYGISEHTLAPFKLDSEYPGIVENIVEPQPPIWVKLENSSDQMFNPCEEKTNKHYTCGFENAVKASETYYGKELWNESNEH